VYLGASYAFINKVFLLIKKSNGGHTSRAGGKKCDHCGGTNHTKPYRWVKYGKPDNVHQVIDRTTQSQPTSTSSRHIFFGSYSCDALTT
jgi:hypothetical protein